jgi:hypothetical protein
VSGLDGAGIPVSILVEGRVATVVGIVKRAYPGASDRRFAIVPRNGRDISIAPGAGTGDSRGSGGASGSGGLGSAPSTPPSALSGALDVDLADLDANPGRLVRAGGLVLELVETGFILDDGTARRTVVLAGAARDYADLIAPGDVLNVIGTVETSSSGPRIVVQDAGGIVLATDLGADPVQGEPSPIASSPSLERPDGLVKSQAEGRTAGLGGAIPVEPTLAGLGTLSLISLASIAVTLLRRRRANRLLAARVAARLESVVRPSGATSETPIGANGP